ncbi:hypothetical protein BHM03_00008533 [Ensete ventricosum]|nr:hypothetical protein BHM03_00008533 [Ensete ventricosum]
MLLSIYTVHKSDDPILAVRLYRVTVNLAIVGFGPPTPCFLTASKEMRGEDASPLLHPAAIPERGFEEEDRLCCSLGLCNDVDVVAEARRLLSLAGPLIAASLLQYSLQLISIMFVGHLGELNLSGASMATSFANVSGFSVLVCAVLSPHLLLSIASIGVGAYRIHNLLASYACHNL